MTDKLQDVVERPARAFRLTLKLDADTKRDLVDALVDLAGRIERDQVTVGTWGSPSDGCAYELRTDPTMTHKRYFEELRQYLSDNAPGKRSA